MGKISSYSTLATLAPADLLIGLDVDNTSMASTGTDFKVPASALLSGSQIFNLVAYGADPTGASSSDSALTAAKAAAGAGSRAILYWPPGTYLLSPFKFDGFCWLGAGPNASILKAASGTSTDFATNKGYVTTDGTPNSNEEATLIMGLGFDGSNLTGTNANNISGGAPTLIAVGNGSTFAWTIPTFIFRDVWVHSSAVGPGVDAHLSRGGRASTTFHSVTVYDCGQAGTNNHGFILGSDQVWSDCTSLNNGGAGFYLDGLTSGTMVNCKAYSGLGSNGYGVIMRHLGSGYTLRGLALQDNAAGGILFDNAQNYDVSGAICDSNGPLNAGVAVTFANTCTGNSVEYIAFDRTYDGGNYRTDQAYALKIDTGSTGNRIVCPRLAQTTAVYGTGTITTTVAWFAPSSGSGMGNDIHFAESANGMQAPAFAATLTPDPTAGTTVAPGALTANITIAAPSTAWPGARLTFIFTQDGTGGRTVTWNAAFVFQTAWTNTGNTAGKRSAASFVYNGSNWVCESPAANVWF